MQRFTISLDDALAEKFDALIASRSYDNRSEAVRDLIRTKIDESSLQVSQALWCIATVNYVYDHHDKTVVERILSLQHEHHELVVTSLHTHLDHSDCLETVMLRGAAGTVHMFSQKLIALRGVRHGNVHIVPLSEKTHTHRLDNGMQMEHVHLAPLS